MVKTLKEKIEKCSNNVRVSLYDIISMEEEVYPVDEKFIAAATNKTEEKKRVKIVQEAKKKRYSGYLDKLRNLFQEIINIFLV